MTLSELLQRYLVEVSAAKKGAQKEAYKIAKLQQHPIGSVKLSSLSGSHLSAYREERLRCVGASTVIKELGLISAAFEIARKEWSIPIASNPVSGIRKPKTPRPRHRRLEQHDNEEERLLSACATFSNPWFLPVVMFALETGMRRGEILALTWQHVHLQDRYVHLQDTKNGESRNVPLSPGAIALLEGLPANSSREGAVFPVHFEALKSAWQRACSRAGIANFRFHDLRHEATSRFFEKGLSVMEVAAITGHKDVRMLQRYTHLRVQDLARKLG